MSGDYAAKERLKFSSQTARVNHTMHQKHVLYMASMKQDEWLKNLLNKADRLKAQQERKLAADLEKQFPTGTRKKTR